ncbi:MAG: protein MraZ [Candidatus Cloacimonadales bacterium]|nr:protein MraZ [Candidatus Cloacimonadales bacterium]
MTNEFLGTFNNSVNKQKWITIPASFKKKFSIESQEMVIVTIGSESNIAIYPLDSWNEKIASLQTGEVKDKQLLVNLRTFANAEQKLESNGRIKIGEELLELAEIKDKVVIKGEGSFISVWNPERYLEFRNRVLEEHKKTFNSLDYQ